MSNATVSIIAPTIVPITSLVIFDSRVENLTGLRQSLLPGVVSYTLMPEEDAFFAITRLLTDTGASHLAIVAHSAPGTIYLGAAPITRPALQANAYLLQEWGITQISIYSCMVGTDELFISELSCLTGAAVIVAK